MTLDFVELLRLLMARVPPGEHQHHGLHIIDGRPSVVVADGSQFHRFFIDDSDFGRSANDVADDIVKMWEASSKFKGGWDDAIQAVLHIIGDIVPENDTHDAFIAELMRRIEMLPTEKS